MKATATSIIFALAVLSAIALASCDTQSCERSAQCGDFPTSDCNAAFNKIALTKRYYVNNGMSAAGVCSGHCYIYVTGLNTLNCDLSGREMVVAYDEWRNRNCRKCGVKTYGDGCQFKIDYTNSCWSTCCTYVVNLLKSRPSGFKSKRLVICLIMHSA